MKIIKRFICRFHTALLPGVVLILLWSTSVAVTPHPDGGVGVFNVRLWGQYASITGDINTPLYNDKQKIGFDVHLPVHRHISLKTGYFLEPGDTVIHDVSFGVRLYFGDPTAHAGNVNPDGPIGLPILDLGGGGRLPDQYPDSVRWRADIAIRLPLMSHITVGGRWHYLEKENIRQADEFYGSLAWYPGVYRPGDEYLNPDGPIGKPAFLLKGGGSENGVFGHLDILFPMDRSYTLGLYLRGERIPIPYTRTAILGGWVRYFPSML